MLRIRWFDTEADEASISWQQASLMMATLFLNFEFWFLDPWIALPLPLYSALVLSGAVLTPLCSFVGPALAVHTLQKPLLQVIEKFYGRVVAWCVRFCATWFLVAWLASMVAIPARTVLWFILKRDTSSIDSGLVAVVLLAFLMATAQQSSHTNAKLALFSNKFGIAILIAALYRVNDGWRAIPDAMTLSGPLTVPELAPQMRGDFLCSNVWTGLTKLACYAAPLVFLASDFSHRMEQKKQVWITAGTGILLPLGLTLLMVEAIELSTGASRCYASSSTPSVAMALWGKTAGSASKGSMMLAAITVFGAVRFGVSALHSVISTPLLNDKWRSVTLGCLLGLAGWGAIQRFNDLIKLSLDVSPTCLAIVAAVITADLINGRFRPEPVYRIDWIGHGAMLGGLSLLLPLNSLPRTKPT